MPARTHARVPLSLKLGSLAAAALLVVVMALPILTLGAAVAA